jgi:hypothetical protein
MDKDRFRTAIAELGLSQQAAGRFLGISGTQAARIALGTVPVPPVIAMLLEVMIAKGLTPTEVLGFAGVDVAAAVEMAKSEQSRREARFW